MQIMKSRDLVLFLVVILAVGSIGCSSRQRTYSSCIKTRDLSIKQEAESKLADAADSISVSLTELAAIEKSNQKKSKLRSPIDSEMVGMNQLISMDWSGPVEPLIRKIASICKYDVKVLGTELGVPILVSITVKNTSVADVLRDINFQCATKANIEIYPSSKIIELRYNK